MSRRIKHHRWGHPSRPACRGGFTLVELLVVVAIIAILASIILPTLGIAKDITRKIVCQANLHDIGHGMQLYVSVFRHYPGHASSLRHGFAYAVWPTRIRNYLGGNREVFNCPSKEEGFEWQRVMGTPGGAFADQEDAREWFYEVGERMLNVHNTPFSYAYNDWGNHGAGPTNNQRGLGGDIRSMVAVNELPMSKVAKPGEMIAIADSQQTGSWDFNIDPTNRWEWPSKIHFEGSNIVFCDGHVEWNLQEYWVNTNLSTPEGKTVARLWNNHNRWTND